MSNSSDNSLQLKSADNPVAVTHEVDSSSNFSNVSHDYKPKTWKGKIWDSYDYPSEERWFLFKLDATLLFLGSAGVFLRYLDQSNLTNAFVSGMKEELSMYGNQLNYASTAWTVGYIVGQFPVTLLMTKVKPHYVLATIEIIWSVITFATSSVSSYKGLYAARFILGLVEAGHFPGIMYIAASWYKPHELSKRTSIIQFCTGVGPMFSGYLQAAAYNNLDGVAGRSGWRWLFIIDGVFSLPLALATLWALPDVPRVQTPNFFFSAKEIELAKLRVPAEVKLHITYKRKDIASWFKTWHIYGFATAFVFIVLSSQITTALPYWFKSYKGDQKFTVAQINVYSTPIYAIQIFFNIVTSYISDGWLKGRRWIVIVAMSIAVFPIYLSLTLIPTHPANRGGRWALYYLCGIAGCKAAQIWTWVNESLIGDPAKRAFVSTFMNGFSYSFLAWVPLIIFQTKDQPYVHKGNITCTILNVFTGFTVLGMAYIESLKIKDGFWQSVNIAKDQGDEENEKEGVAEVLPDAVLI